MVKRRRRPAAAPPSYPKTHSKNAKECLSSIRTIIGALAEKVRTRILSNPSNRSQLGSYALQTLLCNRMDVAKIKSILHKTIRH